MRANLSPALLLSSFLALVPLAASAQQYQWVNDANTAPAGRTSSVSATATALGPNGDAYTAYNFTFGPLNLGSLTFTSSGRLMGDFVLAHYDANGTITGALLTGESGEVSHIQTDPQGNVYAVGRFGTSVQAGTTQLTSANSLPDLFIAKWNSAGTLQWMRHGVQQGFGGLAIYDERLALDSFGRVTVAGTIFADMVIGTDTIRRSGGYRTLFCAQLDATTGNVLWTRSAANQMGVLKARGIAADYYTGTITLSGQCEGANFTWGGTQVGSAAGTIFWMQLNGQTGDLLRSYDGNLASLYDGPYVAAAENGYSYIAVSAYQANFTLNNVSVSLPQGSTSAVVVARLDPNGVPQWVQVLPAGNSSYVFARDITTAPPSALLRTSSAGPATVYLGGHYSTVSDTLSLGTIPLPPTGSGQGSDAYVAALDGSIGTVLWALPGGGKGGMGTRDDQVICLSASTSGQVVFGGESKADSVRFGNILISYPATSGWISGFTGKILQSYNLIEGMAYHDADANGQADPGERTYPGLIVETMPGGRYFSTAANGQYRAVTDLGTYSVGIPVLPPYHSLAGSPSPASFTTYGNMSGGHDFRLVPVANQQDLRVALTPVGRARPGFAVRYRLTYQNVGTVAIPAGSFRMTYDSLLTYVSSTPAATATGNILDWTYLALQPGETRQADVLFQLTTVAPLGHVLNATALLEPIAGDLTPADNTETNQLTVTGSFDPNDIQVNYVTLTEPQVQMAMKALDYTIRFQNLGTDTAFSVMLRDTLPASLLNLGTLQVIASSHTCLWHLTTNGVLTVQLPNIRLPHRAVNTLGSMGFVRFRVIPRTTLVAGDIIPNRADIHFDFNAPVATNTALTTVVNVTGLADTPGAAASLQAWPNPASDLLHVETKATGKAPMTLTLLDATGRVVVSQPATPSSSGLLHERLDVSRVPAGLYLLRVTAGGQALSCRVIVR